MSLVREYGVFRFGHIKISQSLVYGDWLNIKIIFVLRSNECKINSSLHTHTHTHTHTNVCMRM